MADKKISQLTGATTPLAGTEVLPIVQSGSTVKVAVSDLTVGRAVETGALTVKTGTAYTDIAKFSTASTTATENAGGGFSGVPSGTATSREAFMWLDADGANFSGGDYFYILKKGNSGDALIWQQSASNLIFGTSNVDRGRWDTSGNLKIENGNLIVGTSGKGILDSNGNESLLFTATASAVNELTVANAATGNGPTISATGSDTNISINLTAKGSGNVNVTNTNLNVTNKAIAASFNTTASTLSVDNNTATTLYTMPGAGVYTVHAYLLNTGLPDELTAIAIISCAGTSAFIRSNLSGANMVFSLSGLNVQITQTAGSTQTVYYSVQRIA